MTAQGTTQRATWVSVVAHAILGIGAVGLFAYGDLPSWLEAPVLVFGVLELIDYKRCLAECAS